MPIKKSTLEQKWYYRLAKIFFLILPLILIILFLLNKNAITCNVAPANIFDILQKDVVYIIVGLISYFLILTVIWRSFLYIAFGRVEDDTKEESKTAQSVNSVAQPEPEGPKSSKIMQVIPVIIILAIFTIIALSKMGYIKLPKIDLKSNESLNVKSTPIKTTCPTKFNPPCHSVQGGVAMQGGPIPASCENCPSGSHYSGTMDNITPGGPYKICVCD